MHDLVCKHALVLFGIVKSDLLVTEAVHLWLQCSGLDGIVVWNELSIPLDVVSVDGMVRILI